MCPPAEESRPTVLSVACSWPVVRRALGYAVVVGLVLAAINHGPCLLDGCFSWDDCGVKAIVTACVPYIVSTLSSVQALRSRR